MVCYTNDAGRLICGDSVRPEDSRFDRRILNQQGIVIREEQGEITPEEQAEIDAARRAEEERLRSIADQQRYDQMLLDAFLSDDDIASLRDRRLEQLDSQIRIIEILLRNLYSREEELKDRAQRFAPYSEDEDAAPVPENLALDIQRTEANINLREKMLSDIRQDQEEIKRDFQRDIDRFRELKGLPPQHPREQTVSVAD